MKIEVGIGIEVEIGRRSWKVRRDSNKKVWGLSKSMGGGRIYFRRVEKASESLSGNISGEFGTANLFGAGDLGGDIFIEQ